MIWRYLLVTKTKPKNEKINVINHGNPTVMYASKTKLEL